MYTETKKVRTSDSTIRPLNEPWDGHVAPQNTDQNNIVLCERVPIPVAARSKAWVCGRSLAGIEGSYLAGGMDVVSIVCCQVEVSAMGRSLVQRSPTKCGVSEFDVEASKMRKVFESWKIKMNTTKA
jgi:hypothetical protein